MKIEYDGIKFYSFNGSYYRSNNAKNRKRETLHVYKYYKETGNIKVDKTVIHHKDENRLNNNIDNLVPVFQWCHSFYHASIPSNETRKKISEAGRGRKASEETKKKQSDWCFKNKNIIGSKKVKCLETGIIYFSVNEAHRQTGLWNIASVCRGERLDTKGFHFIYS